ncbi:ferric reductase-like transmembrane domain-containing protein [Bartonella sp. B10834G6]|uniref:ferredoxin reductase family protein n=1 Tax=Bartonella apis TaxID=1686310 RepID=UPI0018DB2E09|nr:ferric reductase-like transmembrane domain-containing protein [Bartonella apis]MBH9982327.1 ferric reductase-like transmembrane domain-containing protein [Bartonella apis]
MRNVKISYFVFIFICIAVWLATGEFYGINNGYFAFRREAIQLTGLLAFVAMSIDVVIACRLRLIDNALGGLDKAYRLHKWLGITALVTAIAHFLLTKGTKWAVGWGWLEKPVRHHVDIANLPQKVGLEYVFSICRKNAEVLGEWAFYIAVILCLVALIKLIPYRLFAHVHTILAAVYLVLVFHAVILTKFAYWNEPFGLLVGVSSIFGSVAAITVLLKRFGFGRHIAATVTDYAIDKANDVVRLTLKVTDKWSGHKSGQFAFVTLDKGEGAHPFTIASHWNPQKPFLTFFVKGLGDYTDKLAKQNLTGRKARIDGPYGKFYFSDDKSPQQIWIGAGIGITPFLARLDELASSKKVNKGQINFVYVIQTISDSEKQKLVELAQSAGVRLKIWRTPEEGRFNGSLLRQLFVNWEQSSIWFCGPITFGETLEDDMVKNGFDRARFHRELFQMR